MKGRPFTQNEFWDHLVSKNCGRHVEFKERNKLLLLMLTQCGFRPSELCLITNGLLISSTGELRELFILPEEFSFDGKERPVLIATDEIQNAVEIYYRWLKNISINTHPKKSHLGFDPYLPLLVNDDYREFSFQSRGKKVDGSTKKLPIAMNTLIDSFISKAGFKGAGVARTSFIKTFVIEGYRNEMSIKDLTVFTSLSETTILNYLACDPRQYSQISEWFFDRQQNKNRKLESLRKIRRFKLCLD